MRKFALLGLACAGLILAACSKPTGTVDSASEKLGADSVTSVSFSGSGKTFFFGQPKVPGQPWPEFELVSYEALMAYDQPAAHIKLTRKLVVDPNRAQPDPVEQRTEMLMSGGVAWFIAGQPVPANQNWPASVDERTLEILATPHGFLKAAKANKATVTPVDGGGSDVSFTQGNLKLTGRINAQDQVERVATVIDAPVIGDVPVEYTFSDYKDFGGFTFPGRIQRNQAGFPFMDLNVVAAAKNPQVAITVPETAKGPLGPPNLQSQELAPGVHFVVLGSHNSLLIDQADHIVVVEAPISERHSDALIAKAKELFPGKPIRYVINSHVHFDHSGGLRTFVDEGATIVTHEINKPYFEKIWTNPHTIVPDRLSRSNKPAMFETVGDKHVITDGKRPIEMHLIAGNGHVDGYLMIYLPNEKIIVQADAYTPRPDDAAPLTTFNPMTVNFYDNIQRLKLDVATIAPLHGQVGSYANLRRDVGLAPVK